MKGITPVIAIILLLLITISMVGFAFVWFGRISTLLTNQTESEIVGQQALHCQRIVIDSLSSSTATVYVKNIGTCNIAADAVKVYVSGAEATCTPSLGIMAPGVTDDCDWSGSACTTGTVVKVTAPGSSDETTC